MALLTMYNVDTGIDLTKLTSLARLVEQITGVLVPSNKPVVGNALYQIESGIIASWFKNCGDKFATELFPVRWSAVGQPARHNRHGQGQRHRLRQDVAREQAGIEASEEEALKITAEVKKYSLGTKKLLTEGEFRNVAKKVVGQRAAA